MTHRLGLAATAVYTALVLMDLELSLKFTTKQSMNRGNDMKVLIIKMFTAVVLTLGTTIVAQAQSVNYIDSTGLEWKNLTEITVSDIQTVEDVCASTPCQGMLGAVDVTGWVWANEDEVLDLLHDFSDVIPGSEYSAGAGFIGAMGLVNYSASTYSYYESSFAFTSSVDEDTGNYIYGGWSWSTNLVSLDGFIGFGLVQSNSPGVLSLFLYRDPNIVVEPVIKDMRAP